MAFLCVLPVRRQSVGMVKGIKNGGRQEGLIRAGGTEKGPLNPLKTVAVLTHSVFITPGAFWGLGAQSLIIITVLPTE